jgi:hypothetical protein
MASLFWAINRTGGATGDMDAITTANIIDGDIALVIDESNTTVYIYTYESSNTGVEANPTLIIPDDNSSGTGAWVLVDWHGEDVLTSGSGTMKAGTAGTTITEFSIDGTMAGNSDNAVPTEAAVKTYGDTKAAGLWRTDRIPGFVQRPMFEYKDADEFYISGGGAWELASKDVIYYTNAQLTFHLESSGTNAASDDIAADRAVHYIYIDESTLTSTQTLVAGNFINSLDVPAWSNAKQGWYGSGANNTTTSDRAIFALFGSGVANTINYWDHIGGREVLWKQTWSIASALDIDSGGDNINVSRIPIFSRIALVTVVGNYVDTTGHLQAQESELSDPGNFTVFYQGSTNGRESQYFRVPLDDDQDFSLFFPNGNDTFDVYIHGHALGRGV